MATVVLDRLWMLFAKLAVCQTSSA